jgi:hypothetical protein
MDALPVHYRYHCSIWTRIGDRLASTDLASRAGLFCGAAFGLATMASAIVLLDLSAAPPNVSDKARSERAITETASAHTWQSRLPRIRPGEPPTTGSIAPLAERAPLTEPASITPPHESAASPRVEALRERAVLLASTWPECDQVASSKPVEDRDGSGPHLMVLIECANGTRVYLDEAEIEASRLPVAAQPKAPRLSDADAISACEEQLRLGLPVPRSFSRNAPSTDVARIAGGDPVVTFDFEAVNGFGFPLAQQAKCVFDARELASLRVEPR